MLDDDVRHSLAEIVLGSRSLDDATEKARAFHSTVNEHWDAMQKYAGQCKGVVEYGTGHSTLAWLNACVSVTTVDVEHHDWMDKLLQLAGGKLSFVHGSSLDVGPLECDLLYIDTLHTYDQLRQELHRHAGLCKKFIMMHDTEAFGYPDAALTVKYVPGDRGLWYAINQFLGAHGEWSLEEHFEHQFGLTVLSRKQ